MGFVNTDKTKPVKRIIGGKAYNTATAVLVFHTLGQDDPIEDFGSGTYFPGEEELYRNRHGAFFLLIRDKHYTYHDDYGFEDVIKPISNEAAQKWMELNCQELIEEYFGEIPEAGAKEIRVALRMPSFLEDKAKIIAKNKNLSFNAWLNIVIKKAVDMEKSDVT